MLCDPRIFTAQPVEKLLQNIKILKLSASEHEDQHFYNHSFFAFCMLVTTAEFTLSWKPSIWINKYVML